MKDLSNQSHHLLNTTISINKIWLKFYPEFSSTFKIRKNLTESEFNEISKLRIEFDEIFPFAANLNNMIKSAEFILANFTQNIPTISNYYSKSEIFLSSLSDKIDVFEKILSKNNEVVLKGEASKLSMMLTQSISDEEIIAFQNEFIEINQYFKSFMNFVMQKIKDNFKLYTEKKREVEDKISALNAREEKVKKQKESLLNSILLQ